MTCYQYNRLVQRDFTPTNNPRPERPLWSSCSSKPASLVNVGYDDELMFWRGVGVGVKKVMDVPLLHGHALAAPLLLFREIIGVGVTQVLEQQRAVIKRPSDALNINDVIVPRRVVSLIMADGGKFLKR